MVVRQVANTMGYVATWVHNGVPQTGKVLFKSATAKDAISETSFDYFDYRMEYQAPLFANLKQIVDDSTVIQEVTILKDSVAAVYLVKNVEAAYDGDVFIAMLRKKDV